MTTTTHSRPLAGCQRASLVVPSRALAEREANDAMNLRPLALAGALVLAAPLPAVADSRASRGMGRGPGPCMNVATATERALMRNESNGWPTARNPRSSAFGCAQALLMIRAKYVRRCGSTNPHTTNVAVQMCIFRAYVRDRYGSMGRALQFRRARGYY